MLAFVAWIQLPESQKECIISALTQCLKQLREHYPDHTKYPVYIYETVLDNGKLQELKLICEKFMCIHCVTDKRMFKFDGRWVQYASVESCQDMIKQIHHVALVTQAPWIMKLEPDVLIRGQILLPLDDTNVGIAGCKFQFNTFSEAMKEYGMEESNYSFGGGCLISSKLVNRLIQNIDKIETLFHYLANDGAYIDDMFISFLCCYFGFSIMDWDQIMEEKHTTSEARRMLAPIVHGFKYFYTHKERHDSS